jgi:hypothetical protein
MTGQAVETLAIDIPVMTGRNTPMRTTRCSRYVGTITGGTALGTMQNFEKLARATPTGVRAQAVP